MHILLEVITNLYTLKNKKKRTDYVQAAWVKQ